MKKAATRKTSAAVDSRGETSEYERYGHFHFNMPRQFLMLCRLMQVKPQEIIGDFMDNLSCSTPNRKGRDAAKQHLINYFLEHGYGKGRYTKEEVLSIFREMDAIGLLFPSGGDNHITAIHVQWREEYWKYWFDKWAKKIIER